jgi:hypothetical protein
MDLSFKSGFKLPVVNALNIHFRKALIDNVFCNLSFKCYKAGAASFCWTRSQSPNSQLRSQGYGPNFQPRNLTLLSMALMHEQKKVNELTLIVTKLNLRLLKNVGFLN